MSKKLIAVASAAALALTALVGVAPASATAAAIAYTINGSTPTPTGATAGTRYTVPVPQSNALDAANTLKIAVTNLLPGDVVTVSVTGAAKVTKALHAQSSLVSVATLGAASQTTTIGSGETGEDMFVFTTSTSTTAVSAITISVTETDGTTKSTTNATKYITGTSDDTDGSGNVYKVKNVVAPSTLAAGVEAEVTFTVTDAFDNVLETATIAGALATSAGTLSGAGIATYDTVRDLHVAKVTAASANPFVLTIDANGSTAAPSNLGLGASSTTAVAVVNSTGVATQIAALTTQVAALIADYNALAAKWNKRVTNKTAPKKKVVLK
jgi:hypothetical protein